MKLLTVGDSNTYGFDPRTGGGGRYPEEIRWTGRLSRLPGAEVVNLGLNGECVPREASLAGEAAARLRPDHITVMLGTNDLLSAPEPDPAAVGRAMERYLRDLRGRIGAECRVLLISPPALGPGTWTDPGLITASAALGAYLRPAAEGLGLDFADASLWGAELSFDGVHLSERGHETFAREIRKLLGL